MPERPRDRLAAVVSGGLAAWLLAIAASNHPDRSFDRLRHLDRWGVALPNWRFFSPRPAAHDWHLLYQVHTADGGADWQEAAPAASRTALQALWFPVRRRDKAFWELAFDLLILRQSGAPDPVLADSVPHRVFQGIVEAELARRPAEAAPPVGYRFAVLRSSGYEPEPLRKAFLSPLLPLDPARADHRPKSRLATVR